MNNSNLNFEGQFALVANFFPIEGKEEQLKEIMDKSISDTVGAEGLIQAYVYEPESKKNPFVFTAVWKSKEHFQQFMKSSKAQGAHNNENLRKLHEKALKEATAEMYNVRTEWHLAN